MKMAKWIKRILHRASTTGLNPRWFVSQYRITLVQEGGMPFVKFRIDTVKKARAIASRCFESYGQTDRKQFGVIMLTNQNHIIGFNIASTGSVSSVLVSPREVLKPAILTNAGAIILCYTQPNGDPRDVTVDGFRCASCNRKWAMLRFNKCMAVAVGYESEKSKGRAS
jgi:hypothetical protein